MALTPPRPGLRLVNASNAVAKVELRVEPGEEVEVPTGSVIAEDRSPLRPAAKKAAKKAAAKPTKTDTGA